MATVIVNVHNDHFSQNTRDANEGDTVQFTNDRGSSVTVSLNDFFNQGHVDLGTGTSNKTKTVTLVKAGGTAKYKAPPPPSPKQEGNDIKGDIIVNPN